MRIFRTCSSKFNLLMSTLGLAARYASMRAALECLQACYKSLWWCGRVVDVGKVAGICFQVVVGRLAGGCSQVVELLNAPLVLYVLAATRGKDARVSGSLTCMLRWMGLKQDGAPPVGGGPCEDGLQRAPVDVAGSRYARQLGEGREVVGVEDK